MPDTQRTLSALQTLLADNTAGDISPQDLRDMLVSVWEGAWIKNSTAKTADFTAVTHNDYLVDLATGTPTNVVCTLPATPAYLDKVRVTITADDITASGASVPNKLSWSLNGSNLMSGTDDDPYWLFKEGESLTLTYYGGDVGWVVTDDGRITQFCEITTTAGPTINNTEAIVAHNTVTSDLFEMAVVSTNHIRINRPNRYRVFTFWSATTADATRLVTRPFFDTGSGYAGQFPYTSIQNSHTNGTAIFSDFDYLMGAGDKVAHYARYENSSTTAFTAASNAPRMLVREIL